MSNVRSKRDIFNEELDAALIGKSGNTVIISRETCGLIAASLERLCREGERPRSSQEHNWGRKYYLTNDSNGVTVIARRGQNTLLVAKEDLFDVINEAHIKTGHAGRNLMDKELRQSYYNVTLESIKLFLKLCENCKQKKVRKSDIKRRSFLIQKTSNDMDGPLSVNEACASQQNISTSLLSASKYKSDSKEQTKGEAVVKWIGRTGLPDTTSEDEGFVLMNGRIICPFYEELDQVLDDRTITYPIVVRESAAKEDPKDSAVTPGPSVKTEGLDSVIKMEESPVDYDDIGSANPSTSEPRNGLVLGEDAGQGIKRSDMQTTESQLNSLGERFLAESRREFEEMMSGDRRREASQEQRQAWQHEWQKCQTAMTALSQGLRGNHAYSAHPCGLLSGHHGDLAPAGHRCRSSDPQMTQGCSEEEEAQLSPEVGRCALVPATTPPLSVSAPPAEIPAPPAASQREVSGWPGPSREVSGWPGPSREVARAAKRGRTPSPPAALSAFQQGVLDVLNKDVGEEEQFLLSLVPALKRLDNRKKALVRIKFQQFLYDVEFSDD